MKLFYLLLAIVFITTGVYGLIILLPMPVGNIGVIEWMSFPALLVGVGFLDEYISKYTSN